MTTEAVTVSSRWTSSSRVALSEADGNTAVIFPFPLQLADAPFFLLGDEVVPALPESGAAAAPEATGASHPRSDLESI